MLRGSPARRWLALLALALLACADFASQALLPAALGALSAWCGDKVPEAVQAVLDWVEKVVGEWRL